MWKEYDTVLVSDAGGQFAAQPKPRTNWILHSVRVLDIIDNQVRSLRKQQVVDSFTNGDRKGAYWGIRTNIDKYELANALPCPVKKTMALANTPTRLSRLNRVDQERLINWGYAVCDAAMRKHVDSRFPPPVGFLLSRLRHRSELGLCCWVGSSVMGSTSPGYRHSFANR